MVLPVAPLILARQYAFKTQMSKLLTTSGGNGSRIHSPGWSAVQQTGIAKVQRAFFSD